MRENDIVSLANGKKYSLIKSVIYENKKYFLAGLINEKNDIDLKSILIFEECHDDDDGIYVKVVYDESLLKIIAKMFN